MCVWYGNLPRLQRRVSCDISCFHHTASLAEVQFPVHIDDGRSHEESIERSEAKVGFGEPVRITGTTGQSSSCLHIVPPWARTDDNRVLSILVTGIEKALEEAGWRKAFR